MMNHNLKVHTKATRGGWRSANEHSKLSGVMHRANLDKTPEHRELRMMGMTLDCTEARRYVQTGPEPGIVQC
jgi:hypothetical protein